MPQKTICYSRQQVATHSNRNDCWIIINKKVYDVTHFPHPGKGFIFDLAGQDATGVFNSQHLYPAAQQMLASNTFRKQYLVGTLKPDPKTDELYNYDYDNTRYKEFKQDVINKLQSMGIKNAASHDSVLLQQGLIFLFMVLSYSSFLYAGGYGLCLLTAFAIGLAIVNITHSANHGALAPRNKIISTIGCYLLDLVGQSSKDWRLTHNNEHHQFTGGTLDSEKKHQPYIRMHSSQPHTWLTRIQSVTLPLLLMLHQPFTNLQDLKRFYLASQQGKTTRTEQAAYILTKVLHIILLWLAPMLRFTGGWQYSLIMLFGASIYTTFWIVANHANEACHIHSKPDGMPWYKAQIQSSSNLCAENRFINLLSGGLSHQIEHHLCPGIPDRFLPYLVPLTQKLCRDSGLAYNNFHSVRALGKSFFRRISMFAQLQVNTKPSVHEPKYS